MEDNKYCWGNTEVFCVVTDIACVIKTEMGHIAVSEVEGQTEVSHASRVMQGWSYLVLLWIVTTDGDCTPVLSPCCHPRHRGLGETAANLDSVVTRISHRTLSMVITSHLMPYGIKICFRSNI